MKRRTVVDRDNMRVVYEDGILTSEFPDGDGIARHYHENGTLSDEVPKVAGETQGLCRSWHDNGQLSSEHTIQGGQIIGVARHWESDGTLSHEMEYLTPHAVLVKSYSSGRIRRLFLWEGKPTSKARLMKKVVGAGISPEVLEKRLLTWESNQRSGAA